MARVAETAPPSTHQFFQVLLRQFIITICGENFHFPQRSTKFWLNSVRELALHARLGQFQSENPISFVLNVNLLIIPTYREYAGNNNKRRLLHENYFLFIPTGAVDVWVDDDFCETFVKADSKQNETREKTPRVVECFENRVPKMFFACDPQSASR